MGRRRGEVEAHSFGRVAKGVLPKVMGSKVLPKIMGSSSGVLPKVMVSGVQQVVGSGVLGSAPKGYGIRRRAAEGYGFSFELIAKDYGLEGLAGLGGGG